MEFLGKEKRIGHGSRALEVVSKIWKIVLGKIT